MLKCDVIGTSVEFSKNYAADNHNRLNELYDKLARLKCELDIVPQNLDTVYENYCETEKVIEAYVAEKTKRPCFKLKCNGTMKGKEVVNIFCIRMTELLK